MKYLKLKLLISLFLINSSNGYFLIKDEADFENTNKIKLLPDVQFGLSSRSLSTDEFPKEFSVNLGTHFGKSFDQKFIKNPKNMASNPVSSSDIYEYSHKTKKTLKYASNDNNAKFEVYKSEDGKAYATVYKNKGSNKLKLIATINSENNKAYDIVPVELKQNLKLKSFSLDTNNHAIIARENKKVNYGIDGISANLLDHKIRTKRTISKRAVNGQPNDLYVQLLVVADNSIYTHFKELTGLSNKDSIYKHMKLYYIHMISGVNTMYVNSLKNDPDMRIYVKLQNYVFTTEKMNWFSSSEVGLANRPTYKGRPVLDASKSLNAFKEYIGNFNKFKFDHAAGFFNKELWALNNADDESGAGVVGVAPLSGICIKDSKVSIQEDWGGLFAISTVAHELAHNLGVNHDGEGNACQPSDQYIMSAVGGNNNEKSFIFSPCSITQLKASLLKDNQGVSDLAKCIDSKPAKNELDDTFLSGRLPGKVWTADDQCRQYYGSSSSFVRSESEKMCLNMYCITNKEARTSSRADAAMAGTACGPKKSCLNGLCVSDPEVAANCLWGDDFIHKFAVGLTLKDNAITMNCQDFFDWVISKGESPKTYCKYNSGIASACCMTCPKYEPISCFDEALYDACDNANQCPAASGVMMSGKSYMDICKKQCNNCKTNPKFNCDPNPCLNGGSCRVSDNLFGYTCMCKQGFSGQTCLKDNPCMPNPCANGKCVKLGSFGYDCICEDGYKGYTCNQKIN